MRVDRPGCNGSQLQELEGSKLRLEAALGDARYQLATNGITTQDQVDTLRAKISDIDDKLAVTEARRAIEIHAPGDRHRRVGHPGQTVGAGAPMLRSCKGMRA